MAKGSNNLSGRRSSSRNTKPYDANNSFVKKVATKVTDLIPQRSWITKWFNSSQNEGDALDDSENPEEVESEEETQKPPPLKRPRIRMDITYPPGTFLIQTAAKTPLNKASSPKQQYSMHDETSEDFSEPAMAGPSRMSPIISSTPAMQTDIRNIVPQRSELNSMNAATNNGTTNGTDDNSESSESTSGCSSLIPQINRQEAPSNASYNSPFSNRKRFNNDKLTFNNHTQSLRSLFLDNRDSLSSRRPSFNASVMTNTPDRASPLSSPFYSGNTTFGGANAAGHYKRCRTLFNNSNEIPLKVPRRTSVEVKPSNTTGVDSSGMSQTAKKILEALEHFSSPITDAKKIPLKMINNTSSLSKKRTREETSPTVKVGLRHLTRELIVPSVPDILKLKRRQKLQDTTVAARKIVSARTEPPPPQEYHIRTQADEDSKHHGKLKVKATANLDEEYTIEPVNLPSIPLPISSLPNFNFMPPVNSKTVDKSCIDKEETFTFASPIKVTNVAKNLKSINNFTFSSPIIADKQSIDNSIKSSSPLKRVGTVPTASSSNYVPTVTQNFMSSTSSTAPRLKEKTKNRDSPVPATSKELKSGSVMDILGSKTNITELEKLNETKTGLDSNEDSTNNKADSITLDTNKNDITKVSSSKTDVQQDTSNMWECSECLIKNNSSETQCVTCKTAKRSPKNNKTSELLPTPSAVSESKAAVKDYFGSQFKISSNQWECASCYIRNKQTDIKCVACSALKPASKPETESAATKLPNSDLNTKSLEGSWDCSNCSLKNSANTTICSSCKTSKSSLLNTYPKKEKSVTDDTNITANQTTIMPIDTSLNNSTVTKGEAVDKFKPSKDTWECPCCMVRNVISIDSCPCCNTAKPNTGTTGNATKSAPSSVANGFGDKFKKPEGAWTCDSCMLQNEAKVTECVACGGLKPGSKKSDNSTTNTSSNLQFSFGIPPNAGGFKFGIDKADQEKTDTVTPVSSFKFGENQQSSQIGQFTFGIQKEEKKTSSETLKSTSSAPSMVGSGFGLQVGSKPVEKTDLKQDSEKLEKRPASSFSFGMRKPENATAANDKQSAIVASTIQSTTLPSTFTFGVPKSEIKQPGMDKGKQQGSLLENPMIEASKPNTKVTESSTATNVSTLTSVTQSSSQELKSTPIFTFGIPNNTVAVSTSVSTSVVTSLPSTTKSSFVFSETKPAQTTTLPTFGQITASAPASTPSTTFTFGENKTKEGISATKTFGALPNGPSGNSIFSNISNTPSLFGTSDAKTTPAFGTEENKQPTFGANASKPFTFAMPDPKAPTFGTVENKPSIFGSSDTKIPVFGSPDNKPTPLFSATPQAPTATTTPTFSAPTATPTFSAPSATPTFSAPSATPTFNAPSATPSLFGSPVTPVFGSNAPSTFATETKPNIFGSTAKQDETNTPSPSRFTFNATPAQPVAQPASGFKFSTNTNPAGTTQKPLFTFGSNTNTPPSNNVFGGTFNAPGSSTTSGFTFNAPKPETPAFGQSAIAPPIFGTPQSRTQEQPSSSFASTPANTGFNFGSTAPATTSGGFNFGAAAPFPAASSGEFNFNPARFTQTFDPSATPFICFTGGNAPTAFSGTPQAVGQRKIKKACRRMR